MTKRHAHLLMACQLSLKTRQIFAQVVRSRPACSDFTITGWSPTSTKASILFMAWSIIGACLHIEPQTRVWICLIPLWLPSQQQEVPSNKPIVCTSIYYLAELCHTENRTGLPIFPLKTSPPRDTHLPWTKKVMFKTTKKGNNSGPL